MSLPKSTTEQMKKSQESEGVRLNLHRIHFGKRWDSVMDFRRMEEHNRICRELISTFKAQDSYVGYGGLSDNEIDDVEVDVDHWGKEW